jgi:hypothetical protein
MVQSLKAKQALIDISTAIQTLFQAIGQMINSPPQQHTVLIRTTSAIVGAGVEKPAKCNGKKRQHPEE